MDGSVAADLEWRPDSDPCARVGTTLRGKWHLDALLGVGGTASVYSGTHRNGIVGAVKVLHPDYARDEFTRERFLREGFVANLVDHPGIVQVIDDDETEDGEPFLVMELLEGRALNDATASCGGSIEPDRLLLLVDQLLDALIAAHDAGIVHRDLKPENMFLTRDGRVKILDFGIARMPEGPRSSPRATLVGMPMGTPGFMPPEQARGRWDVVGPQSDLWAVGATMFTLVTGKLVHDGITPAEVLIAAGSQPAPSLATVAPTTPHGIVEIVDRALQMRLADRWEDARAMRGAVQAAFREMTGLPMPQPPPQPSGPVWIASSRRPRASAPSSRETETVASVEKATRRSSTALGTWTVGGALAVGLTIACTTLVARDAPDLPLPEPAAAALLAQPKAAAPTTSTPPPAPVVDETTTSVVSVVTPQGNARSPASPAPPARPGDSSTPRRRPDLKSLYDRRM